PLQLPVVHLGSGRKLDAREHLHDLLERPELLHLLELRQEILEREAVLPKLLLEILGLSNVEALLRPLDERDDVPHPEEARRQAIGVKRLEPVQFLADAEISDRRPRHGPERERGAAA